MYFVYFNIRNQAGVRRSKRIQAQGGRFQGFLLAQGSLIEELNEDSDEEYSK